MPGLNKGRKLSITITSGSSVNQARVFGVEAFPFGGRCILNKKLTSAQSQRNSDMKPAAGGKGVTPASPHQDHTEVYQHVNGPLAAALWKPEAGSVYGFVWPQS